MTLTSALADVWNERQAQDARWGEQNHPDTGGLLHWIRRLDYRRVLRNIRSAEARDRETGHLGWDYILLEEAYEAVSETDPAALRTELIQVAAVAVAWVQAIDRRESK